MLLKSWMSVSFDGQVIRSPVVVIGYDGDIVCFYDKKGKLGFCDPAKIEVIIKHDDFRSWQNAFSTE